MDCYSKGQYISTIHVLYCIVVYTMELEEGGKKGKAEREFWLLSIEFWQFL